MSYFIVPLFATLCVALHVARAGAAGSPCPSYLSPTGNLREVVIAKCTVYQEIVNPAQFCDGKTYEPRNCTEVWEAFSTAFQFQPRCNVSDGRYEGYITMTHHPVPKDKSMFWENVYPFVHRFSNKGATYFTLSDTMTGYIANQLLWCSDPTLGMSKAPTECPEWDPTPDCPQSAQRAFWIAASRSFGRRASGVIHIMLNASSSPIYSNTTYMAMFELPHLPKTVTKASILLINENPDSDRSKCTDQSLKTMEREMNDRGIQFECVENRRDVVQLLCLDSPQSGACAVLKEETSGATLVISSHVTLAVFVILQTFL